MARKRLSDLLREEANKPEENEADTPPAVDAGKIRRTSTRPAKQGDTASSQSTSTETVEAAKGFTDSDSDKTQAQAAELKAAQDQAQQQEVAFQKKTTELQTELDKQIALTRSLKADLEKIEPLKAELERAKKVALQLAEENTRLNQELKALQSQKVPPTSSTAIAPKAVNRNAPSASSAAISNREAMQRQQARTLAHPVFPTQSLPGQISDQDLGWVD